MSKLPGVAEIYLESKLGMILGDALAGPAIRILERLWRSHKELALEDGGLPSGSRNTPVSRFQLSSS